MADAKPQTFANHTRLDPLFHFFVLPVFAITWIGSIVQLVRHPSIHSAWWVVVMSAVLVAVTRIRVYSLRVQDRVIRLEERLRLVSVLPEPLRSRIGELSGSQLIARALPRMQSWPGSWIKSCRKNSSAPISRRQW